MQRTPHQSRVQTRHQGSGAWHAMSHVMKGPACCRAWQLQYSQFTELLPTRAFLVPLEEDEELEVELSKGNVVSIKYKALAELQPNGTRASPRPSIQNAALLMLALRHVELTGILPRAP